MVISKLMGKAVVMDRDDIAKKLKPILIENEKIEIAFSLIRDMIVFTNKRVIQIDVQGVTGSKVEYHSIPYNSISHFSIETAGTLDLDFDLKIWVKGMKNPYERKIKRGGDRAHEVNRILARYTC